MSHTPLCVRDFSKDHALSMQCSETYIDQERLARVCAFDL